ncbi:4-(cytidine 5'-diphospho)-2-C-methyl-D-erythritol kinase [Pseudooceanicola sp. C21-150M6]|uniref:4-(cytidine 5'-diphospho)-2-C-methyl-D-erythritol kinase n=1 Tax=Pseudooceanicola sp. C21-150M6 TaxID=3434355 RepID=UPI003D7F8EA6
MIPDGAVQEFAPAKVNLSLHVTGQRPDGYHLLDSLVAFADIGDHLTMMKADVPRVSVTGPLASGVPTGPNNLVLKAAAFMNLTADIVLDKHLPAAAGIGGGSSDAAAVLRGLSTLYARPLPCGTEALGADVPVCLTPRVSRLQGVGERITPLPALPPLHGVLVNPGVSVATPAVFNAMSQRTNPPMPEPLPRWNDTETLIGWLADQRNDMEAAAIACAPIIRDVLHQIAQSPLCRLARMSGSGATCFGLTTTRPDAEALAAALRQTGWWVQPVTFA